MLADLPGELMVDLPGELLAVLPARHFHIFYYRVTSPQWQCNAVLKHRVYQCILYRVVKRFPNQPRIVPVVPTWNPWICIVQTETDVHAFKQTHSI